MDFVSGLWSYLLLLLSVCCVVESLLDCAVSVEALLDCAAHTRLWISGSACSIGVSFSILET